METLDRKLALAPASRYSAPQNQAGILPLVYGDLTGGAGGQYRAVCLDVDGGVYALAGHELLSAAQGQAVSLFDKDGNAIDPADYTLDLAHDYQGQGTIATAGFGSDQRELEPITVQAKGKPAADGGLIQNPVLIAKDLLIGVQGLGADQLEGGSFTRAAARAGGLGFAAAGVIQKSSSAGEALTQLLAEFLGSWWRGGDGRIKLTLDTGPGASLDAELTHSFSQSGLKDIQVSASLDDLINQAGALYQYNFASGDFQGSWQGDQARDLRSISLHGLRATTLELYWVRDEDAAQAVCGRMVSLLARPRRVISFADTSLAGLALEKGDAALFGLDWLADPEGLPLVNQIVRVLGIEPSLDKNSVGFTVLDTGLYKTLAHQAGGGDEGPGLADGSWRAGGRRDRRRY